MKKLPAFLVAALLVVPYSLASYITINAQLPEISASDNAAAKFTVSNTGDEAAFSVQTSFKSADGVSFPALFSDKLEQGKQVDTFFNLNITKNILPGRYPILIVTEYADANNYQFSAVSASFLTYKDRTSSNVNGFFDDVQIPKGGKAKIGFKMVNRDPVDRNVKINVLVPKELFVGNYDRNISLRPGEQKSTSMEISSLAALQGSTYTVFATVEYEDSGKHYSSFSRGLVRITKDEGMFSNIAIGAVVLILAVMIFIHNFRGRKR